jgi:diguanylate cyclase (GGDEF)-like protein
MLTTSKVLALAPNPSRFELTFASLDFSAPKTLKYRYKLQGYDNEWHMTDASKRLAVYNRLPPGNFELIVNGTNRSGEWSEKQLNIAITVKAAFNQTLQFYFLCAALMGTLIYGVYRLRVQQLKNNAVELEKTVSKRTHELQAAYELLEQASLTDHLTQLNNRRVFEKSIQSDLALVQRNYGDLQPQKSDLIFFLIDLDHFKQVNDLYGHTAGDAVLQQTADILQGCLRSSDYVIRWGGEEFLLIARFIHRKEAMDIAEKLRLAFEQNSFALPDGTALKKTTSIGFAIYPFSQSCPKAVSLKHTIQIADASLYAAKYSGRNGWVGLCCNEGSAFHTEDVQSKVEQFLNAGDKSQLSGEFLIHSSLGDKALNWS